MVWVAAVCLDALPPPTPPGAVTICHVGRSGVSYTLTLSEREARTTLRENRLDYVGNCWFGSR